MQGKGGSVFKPTRRETPRLAKALLFPRVLDAILFASDTQRRGTQESSREGDVYLLAVHLLLEPVCFSISLAKFYFIKGGSAEAALFIWATCVFFEYEGLINSPWSKETQGQADFMSS